MTDASTNGTQNDNVFRLQDDRLLGYAEYGSSSGQPVFFFHGTPGSRLFSRFVGNVAADLGIHLIAPERPGMGLSGYKNHWTIRTVVEDVTQLADGLDIDSFSVLGASGGGPYAVAFAHGLPERITNAGVVSGVAPPESPDSAGGLGDPPDTLKQYAPWALRVPFSITGYIARNYPERFESMVEDPDIKDQTFSPSEVADVFRRDTIESFRTGTKGTVRDLILIRSQWPFELSEVQTKLRIWHGEKDETEPVANARYMADELPEAETTFYPDAGHVSAVINHKEEILRSLVK